MDSIQKHITIHSSLLILHPPFFTLNPTPPILHSASFNFQPYSRGCSLTWKKPFLFLSNLHNIILCGKGDTFLELWLWTLVSDLHMSQARLRNGLKLCVLLERATQDKVSLAETHSPTSYTLQDLQLAQKVLA